ncbi:MAG TPA: hypothetical protein VMB79_00240 [Jatrophihabitans sp.]|nr:hypothetical protein [Jatrophihabitans sp.]
MTFTQMRATQPTQELPSGKFETTLLGADDRPNLAGDLDIMFASAPAFRWKRHGYSVDEVDNYIAWLLDELRAARQAAHTLLQTTLETASQLTVQQQELATLRARQLDVRSQHAPDWLPARIQDILQLANDEAAAIRAEAAADAERLRERALAEARTEIARIELQAAERLAAVRGQTTMQLQLRDQAAQVLRDFVAHLDSALDGGRHAG